MRLQILLDGVLLIASDVDGANLTQVLDDAVKRNSAIFQNTNSCAISEAGLQDFLSRLRPIHVELLRKIALNNGRLSWSTIRELLDIPNEDDFEIFSFGHYQEITMHFRAILKDHQARLIWWDERAWIESDWDSARCSVCVDGPALSALRQVLLGT